MLAEENKPLETLFFICAGHVRVTIAGREVAHLEKGNFVGEVAFLTEKPATATVVAEDSVRALVFERAELSRFFRNEAEVAGLIYQLLGRELATQDQGQQHPDLRGGGLTPRAKCRSLITAGYPLPSSSSRSFSSASSFAC